MTKQNNLPEKCKDCLYRNSDTLFCGINRIKYAWAEFKKALFSGAKSHDCRWYESDKILEVNRPHEEAKRK